MEKEFNFNKYWGSLLLEPHVVFRRNSYMYCVYCGDKAETREHCPPKAFLLKPYPTNLPTVPACTKCNNGFSSDERYASNFIECLAEYYEDDNVNAFQIAEGDFEEIRKAKEAAKLFVEQPFFDDKLANVFRKVAVCHAAYEISMGFHSEEWEGVPERISYTIKPFMPQKEWEGLEYAEMINNEPMPEMGSRAFRNIYVVGIRGWSIKKEKEVMIPVVMVDWSEIQNGFYKYQVYFKDNKIWVKMIFRDFLYCEVVFASKNDYT